MRLKHLVMMGSIVAVLIYGVFSLQDVYQNYRLSKQYVQIELKTKLGMGTDFLEKLKLIQEDDIGFAFWSEQKNAVIHNSNFLRNQTVKAQMVKGDTGCLYPNQNSLELTDAGSCLIDQTTAFNLFGTSDVVGKQVEFQGESYNIKGILSVKETGLFVYECNEQEEGINFDYLSLKLKEGMTAADMEKLFLNRYGIE